MLLYIDINNIGLAVPFTIIFILALLAIIPVLSEKLEQHGHQLKSFENFSFSPRTFYTMVEKAVNTRGLKMKFYLVQYFEKPMIYDKRDYLRIEFDDYVYIICAAPLGTSYFISWRQFIRLSAWEKFRKSIPFVKKFHRVKTYFQEDVEIMFRAAVQGGLQEAMNEMGNTTGALRPDITPLSNTESASIASNN